MSDLKEAVKVQTDFRHPKERISKLSSNFSCDKQCVIEEYNHERSCGFYKK